MLGEQIGEETGKVTVRRVISVDGGTKVEVIDAGHREAPGGRNPEQRHRTGRESGQTGASTARRKAWSSGKGGEQATWKGAGVGKLLDGGAVSYRGALYYYSDSPNFRRLNAGRRGLRVQRRRRREHEEQVLGVEVDLTWYLAADVTVEIPRPAERAIHSPESRRRCCPATIASACDRMMFCRMAVRAAAVIDIISTPLAASSGPSSFHSCFITTSP